MEPKVRYKNSGIWLYEKVGNICDLLTGFPFPGDKIVLNGNTLLLRGINITEGVIRHSKEIDRYYNESTLGLEKYRLEVDDLVIGMDGSKVGKNSALITSKEQNSLLVQRVARLRHEDKNLINLIQIGVGSRRFIKYVEEIKTSSAIPHISPDDIRNFTISLPEDSVERQFVAGYFTSLDSLIVASNSNIASLKKLKSASLVAMFPQNGESTPKVRFKGFEWEWEKVKLGNVCSVNRGTRITKKELDTNHSYPVYQNTNYPLGYYKNYNVEANNPYVIIGGSAGLIGFSNVPFWAADDCAYFGDNESLDKTFLYSTLLFHIAEIKRNVRGSSVPRLDRSTLIDLEINLPSFSEQQAIASYFRSLDRKIALETARLEKLKQIKLACLDKMFV